MVLTHNFMTLLPPSTFLQNLPETNDTFFALTPFLRSQRCCQCKADVVQEDETEVSGRRAILNDGHTFGHAIEAISIGMVAEAELVKSLVLVDEAFCNRQKSFFEAAG